MRALGLDHVDIRVPSIAVVETFYDQLMPALGLTRKSESHVGADGEWTNVDAEHPRNAIEFFSTAEAETIGWFVGFIEDPGMVPTATRIAFGLERESDLIAAEQVVRSAGGRVVEWSIDPSYPALFFEDPAGTRLEICARRPPSREA